MSRREEFLKRLGRDPTDPTAPPKAPVNTDLFGSDYLTNFGAGKPHPTTGIPTYPLYGGGIAAGADYNSLPRGAALINSAMTPLNPAPTKGLLVQGNIDPYHRRTLYNPDGSISTTTSSSTEATRGQYQGKEILVPTVVNGMRMTMDQAMDRFYRTGEHFGIFNNGDDADAYATWLHLEQVRHGGGFEIPPFAQR